MEKELMTHELIPGTRYWLDRQKDISGIFIKAERHIATFDQIHGNYIYITDSNGHVRLSDNVDGFYPIQNK